MPKNQSTALSKREQQLLTLIASFRESQGTSPTYRQLQQMLGLSSVGTIHAHIRQLKNKKLLSSDKKWRSLKTDASISHPKIPIIGAISRGEKIELFSQISLQPLPYTLVPLDRTCYGFVVQDFSFTHELIQQGDILIVEARTVPQVGELLLTSSKEHGVQILRATEHAISSNIHGVIASLLRDYNKK